MTHRQAVDTLASERYLLDEMSELERYAFEEHFFACRECAEDVLAGERMRQQVKSALAEPAAAPGLTHGPIDSNRASARAWWARPAVALPWACAASFAILFGYQALLVVPELRRIEAPRAFAPVVLHPASRGADPIVPLAPESPFALLTLDVNAPDLRGSVSYEVTSDAGSRVASGSAPAPAPGTPLLLMIPTRLLSPDVHYTIRLGNGSASPIGEYRFAAGRAR